MEQCINYGPSCFPVLAIRATPTQVYIEAHLNVKAYEYFELNTVYPALRLVTAKGEELCLDPNMLEGMKLDLEPGCEPLMTLMFGLPPEEEE